MTDFSLGLRNDLICGMSGSGKTTLVLRYLVNANPAGRFIFDDENRVAPRLRIKPCYTETELEDSLATRWTIFNPSRMFFFQEKIDRDLLSPKRRAFRWFCAWLFNVAGRGPGLKIISLPEIWRFCTPDTIPFEFAQLMQMGRELNTHVLMDTQRPELVNPSVTGQATELICFKLLPSGQPDCPLKTIAKLGADAVKVKNLPLGQFIGQNRLSGEILEGRLF